LLLHSLYISPPDFDGRAFFAKSKKIPYATVDIEGLLNVLNKRPR
jgi:hypothetical protein